MGVNLFDTTSLPLKEFSSTFTKTGSFPEGNLPNVDSIYFFAETWSKFPDNIKVILFAI